MAEKKTTADSATDTASDAANRMRDTGNAMMDQGSRLSMRMLDQAEQNTQEAFRAMREAAKAKDLSEVMRIQSDFIREQGSRSVSQAREIGEMIADFGRTTISQMTGRK
ncbi:phasin family protein [Stakelama saccharophila]|uniref:Phasin family protein n=1 Tax=Stakelama saccharophila TaxID=3075605 RepID=A0ABZ0B960_9SPHN|nr:phasin family protein [Stakelama sp. W311]WNO53156.1 phasin family protein [Stakelama sp. W311]